MQHCYNHKYDAHHMSQQTQSRIISYDFFMKKKEDNFRNYIALMHYPTHTIVQK